MNTDFSKIHQQVVEFLSRDKIDVLSLQDPNFKLPLSDAIFCAEDPIRNRVFFHAIQQSIFDLHQKKKNIVVVDAGSGTGILGIFTLLLGANKCYFLEHNPHSLELSKKLLAHFGYSDRSEFLICDATKIELPEKYDLLICEAITSGFVREDFPRIVNHLQKFGFPESKIIPEKFEITILEKDQQKNILAKHHVQFSSQEKFQKQKIQLKNSQTNILTFQTRAILLGEISLSSGDAMSFLNEQTMDPKKEIHQLFEFSFPKE